MGVVYGFVLSVVSRLVIELCLVSLVCGLIWSYGFSMKLCLNVCGCGSVSCLLVFEILVKLMMLRLRVWLF